MRWIHLGLGVMFSTAYLLAEFQTIYPTDLFPLMDRLVKVLVCLVVWSWLTAVFGFGMVHLNFTNPFLKYANEAVLPFYIIHQSVLICLGFFVMEWAIPDLLKFLIVLTATFILSMGLYEFGVRRFNLMRFLFGMKLHSKPAKKPALETQRGESIQTM